MKKLLLIPVFLFLLLNAAHADQKVLRVRDGKTIDFATMVEDLKKVAVVFVGEVHDEPGHHRDELKVIRALHESDKPLAIGLEMFRTDSQSSLNSWVRGELPPDRFIPVFYENWRLPWPLYRDIFDYAREHELALVGLNIPDAISKKIAREGFLSLSAEEKKQLPPGISCNVDPTYMDFIRKAYAGHTGRKDKEFVNFCEAQMVWDKAMAWHAAGYLKKNPDKTMIVLAGVGHAWKRGISEQLPQDAKLSYRVVLPTVPDQIDRQSVTTQDADYVLLQ